MARAGESAEGAGAPQVTSVSSATIIGGGFLSDQQLMDVDESLPEVPFHTPPKCPHTCSPHAP